jgi:hypothetical protein
MGRWIEKVQDPFVGGELFGGVNYLPSPSDTKAEKEIKWVMFNQWTGSVNLNEYYLEGYVNGVPRLRIGMYNEVPDEDLGDPVSPQQLLSWQKKLATESEAKILHNEPWD